MTRTTTTAVIDPRAQQAHAWLRGISDARLAKPDAARELYPEDGTLRDSYLAGRLAA